MKVFTITYTTIWGRTKAVDINAYMEYTAISRFKKEYSGKYRGIVSIEVFY